ncbi:hypothetical protein JCM3766R1_006645 [Sporobolomyces carnicolor]
MAESTLPDPLLALRSALSSSQSITLLSATSSEVFSISESTHISFPSLATSPSFPKATPTRFYAGPSPDHSDPSAPVYDLQTLLFGWLQKDLPTGEYVKAARGQGVGFISATDRRMLMEYLGGKGSSDEGPGTRIRAMTEAEKEATRKVLPNVGGAIGEPGRDAGDSTSASANAAAANNSMDASGGPGTQAAGGDGQGQPPLKKVRYTADKGDQDKVQKMLHIMNGPQFGYVVAPNEVGSTTAGGSGAGGAKVDRLGGGAAHHSRETILRGERYNNFDSVRALIAPRLKVLGSVMNTSSSSSKPTTASAQPGALKPVQSSSSKKKQLNPIIMISPSSTALITMHNVKEFLQDARFVPSEQAKSEAARGNSSGYLAEDVVQVNHARASSGGGIETRQARYFVVDSVDALEKLAGQGKGAEAWDRVVCVMTTGQEWQFKGYKWSEPKELFHNVKGVYPQWSSDPSNAKVKSWNVAELRIEPLKRHRDKSVVADFWKNLEDWIARNKPWLSY